MMRKKLPGHLFQTVVRTLGYIHRNLCTECCCYRKHETGKNKTEIVLGKKEFTIQGDKLNVCDS